MKEKREKRSKLSAQAENQGKEAIEEIKKLLETVKDPKLEILPEKKVILEKNINDLLSEIDKAKNEHKSQDQNSKLYEKYWEELKSARKKFQEELKILFPNININDKKLDIATETFDLFILYIYNKLLYYEEQHEMLKVTKYI